jgi:hypothetical protein
MDIPATFWNQHLRRMVLSWMVDNAAEVEPLIREQLAGIYGMAEGGRRTPGQHRGPFSYRGYLQYMAHSSSWGDEITLLMFSLMLDVKVTVIQAQGLNHIKLRHADPTLDTVDFVLLYNGSSHYSKIGKSPVCSSRCA